MANEVTQSCSRTSVAFIASSILSAPLLAIYNFIGVILYRDLAGTQFQVTVLTMLKPIVALFSLYWSYRIAERSDRLKSNLLWSGLLGRLPFLFFPFISDPWIIIASAGFYMMLSRGGIPAWMEIFKRNLTKDHRGRVFSDGTALSYIEGLFLAIGIGLVLDSRAESWRWLFPMAAIAGILGVFFQARIPVKATIPSPSTQPMASVWRMLTDPWRNAFALMKARPDFHRFQWGYMLCGSGMMIIQPALPFFFVDVLGVTYTELAIALTVCKGLGFALTSRLWARWFKNANVFVFSALIFFCVGIFPLLLLLAPTHLFWLYFGYFLYGVGQAGSELCWHLSGLSFAHDCDSAMYSGVNVAMVGIRGLIAPPLGSLFCVLAGPTFVFGLSSLMCGASAYLMWHWMHATPLQTAPATT